MLSVLVPPLLFYILFSFAPEPSYFYICSLYSCLDLTSLTPIHVYNFSFTTLQAWFGRVPWWVLRSFVLIKGLCESIASLPRRLGPFTLLSRWRTFTDSTRVFHRFLFFFFFALAIVFTLPPAWWVVSFLLSYPLHCWIFLLCRLVCASIGVMTTLSCLNDDDDISLLPFPSGVMEGPPLLMSRLTSAVAFTCFGSAPYTISKVKCMSPPPCTTLLAMTMAWSWVSCYFGAAMMMFKHLPFSEAWWKQYIWATIWDPLPSLQNHDWHLWIPARYTLCSFVKSHLLMHSSLSSLILQLWAVHMAVVAFNTCSRALVQPYLALSR